MNFFIILLSFLSALEGFLCFKIDLNSTPEDQTRDKVLAKLAASHHALRFPKFKQRHIKLLTSRFEDKALVSYYGEIQVGEPKDGSPQKFMMLFDTGSSEFFIPSENCKSEECKNHNKYRFSKNFKQTLNTSNLEYISGSLEGPVGKETVLLGDIKIDDQRIHLGNQVSIPILLSVKWDGILGLSFSDFSSTVIETKETILDTLLKRKILRDNFFTYHMEDNHGSVSFGEIDSTFKDKEIMWAPLVSRKRPDAWTIDVKEIKLNTKNKEPNSIKKINNCLVDTGTFLTYIPREEFERLFKHVNYILKNCEEKSRLPPISFFIAGQDGKDVELILHPDDYVMTYKRHGQQKCVISFAHDDVLNDTITLGQVFLKSFYTIFDFGQKKIGFIPLRDSKAKAKEVPKPSSRFHKTHDHPSHPHSRHQLNLYYHPFHQISSPRSMDSLNEENLKLNIAKDKSKIDEISSNLGRQLNSNERKHARIEALGSRHRFDGTLEHFIGA